MLDWAMSPMYQNKNVTPRGWFNFKCPLFIVFSFRLAIKHVETARTCCILGIIEGLRFMKIKIFLNALLNVN